MYLRPLTFLLLSVFWIQDGYSQSSIVRFENLTNNDGLSSNHVNSIYQDRKGFIWFGTNDGLSRFDGLQFTNYQHSVKNPESLKDSYIDAITEDPEGNLIIGTSSGINVFDWKTNSFTSLNFESLPQVVDKGNIEYIFSIKQGIWVSVEDQGLFELSYHDKSINHFTVENGLHANNIQLVTQSDDGTIWAVVEGKLQYLRKGQFHTVSLGDLNISSICDGNDEYTWIGTSASGLYKIKSQDLLSNSQGSLQQVIGGKQAMNEIQSLFMDSQGAIWGGLEGDGLIRIDPNGSIEHFANSPEDEFSLGYNSILTIYEDQVGDLWMGTIAGGVSVVHFSKQNFKNLFANSATKNSLSKNDVTRISEDRAGKLWIGTKTGGINRYDPTNGEFSTFDEINSFIKNNSVESVLGASDGSIWLGGWKSGLYQVDEQFNLLRSFDMENSVLRSDNVYDLLEDKQGNIWIGTIWGGLSMITPDNKMISLLDEGLITDENPITLALDSSNQILMGGWSGLTRFDYQSGTSTTYTYQEDLSGISSNTIQSIWVASIDTIWIGTDDGLNLFNPQNETFTHFFMEDGLPSNAIKSLVGVDNELWISTNDGISKLDLTTGDFQNITPQDGIQGKQFTTNSALLSSFGEIYFGGVNGITSFDPTYLAFNQQAPDVILTDLKINNENIGELDGLSDLAHISELKEISLKHYQSYLSFYFIALNYSSSQQNKYQYKLEGFDPDWISSETTTAFYSNIAPGEYTFRVKASNNNGVWNETGASLRVVILPPWWQTWWARTLTVAIPLLLLFVFYKVRVGMLKNQKKKLEHQVQERTSEISQQNEKLIKLREREQELSEAAIRSKETQLASMSMAAHEKNNLLKDLEQKVSFLEERFGDEMKSDLRSLKRTISNGYSLDDSWDSFLHNFQDVHPQFFDSLKHNNPSLTNDDLKVSAYLKIGMTNKEIAKVTNLSLVAVKSRINRLKKKLDLKAEDSIRDYVLRYA